MKLSPDCNEEADTVGPNPKVRFIGLLMCVETDNGADNDEPEPGYQVKHEMRMHDDSSKCVS